jgi:5-methylcytosine-specific restriction endonuclease McrA
MVNPRKGRRWEAIRLQVITDSDGICGICGEPVERWRPYRNRLGQIDPLSPSVDHIRPISQGGHPYDLANLQLALRAAGAYDHAGVALLN